MGKREGTDLPFVATGRAELKFPSEEDEEKRLTDESGGAAARRRGRRGQRGRDARRRD